MQLCKQKYQSVTGEQSKRGSGIQMWTVRLREISRTDAKQKNQALKVGGNTLSTISTSFPKRFKIRPDGVVS